MTPPKEAAKKAPATVQNNAPPVPEMTPREMRELRPELEKIGVSIPEAGIAERIKEARQRPENGLSIEALSRMCKLVDPTGRGIAHQTLVKYEKGIVLPGLRELRVLSQALDVSTDWLIFGAERGEEGSPVITMDAALLELAAVLKERIAKASNPLWFFPSGGEARPLLLAKARAPKPRE